MNAGVVLPQICDCAIVNVEPYRLFSHCYCIGGWLSSSLEVLVHQIGLSMRLTELEERKNSAWDQTLGLKGWDERPNANGLLSQKVHRPHSEIFCNALLSQ